MVRSPSPRPTRPVRPIARPAPAVRDFRNTSASYRIEWDVRSIYDFVFSLSRDEFLSIFFEDLELPNLMRTAVTDRLRATSSASIESNETMH